LSSCRSVHIKERLRLINKQEDRKAERHFFLRYLFLSESGFTGLWDEQDKKRGAAVSCKP
jgi:hypothetical protein